MGYKSFEKLEVYKAAREYRNKMLNGNIAYLRKRKTRIQTNSINPINSINQSTNNLMNPIYIIILLTREIHSITVKCVSPVQSTWYRN